MPEKQVPWWRREVAMSAEGRLLLFAAIVVLFFLAGLFVGSVLS